MRNLHKERGHQMNVLNQRFFTKDLLDAAMKHAYDEGAKDGAIAEIQGNKPGLCDYKSSYAAGFVETIFKENDK